MSKLTPVKRVDKNGVLTTKHVRVDDPQKKTASKMPAPAIASQKKAPATASTTQKRWRVNKAKWDTCDDELKYLCTKKFTALQQYECSDAEAYDLLTAVYPENALPLLSIGLRSAESARAFLDETGLGRLKADNSPVAPEAIGKLVNDAIDRGVPARDFLEFAAKHHRSIYSETFIDAAECWANNPSKQTDYYRAERNLRPVRDLILEGKINWSDIKEIGINDAVGLVQSDDTLIDVLSRLKDGTSGFSSASEIPEVMRDSSDAPTNIALADVFGVEGYREIGAMHRYDAARLLNALRERDHTNEQRLDIFKYSRRVGLNPEPSAIVSLYDAGVSAEEARLGLVGKLTINQIIALHEGEVESSLSSGYL